MGFCLQQHLVFLWGPLGNGLLHEHFANLGRPLILHLLFSACARSLRGSRCNQSRAVSLPFPRTWPRQRPSLSVHVCAPATHLHMPGKLAMKPLGCCAYHCTPCRLQVGGVTQPVPNHANSTELHSWTVKGAQGLHHVASNNSVAYPQLGMSACVQWWTCGCCVVLYGITPPCALTEMRSSPMS